MERLGKTTNILRKSNFGIEIWTCEVPKYEEGTDRLCGWQVFSFSLQPYLLSPVLYRPLLIIMLKEAYPHPLLDRLHSSGLPTYLLLTMVEVIIWRFSAVRWQIIAVVQRIAVAWVIVQGVPKLCFICATTQPSKQSNYSLNITHQQVRQSYITYLFKNYLR